MTRSVACHNPRPCLLAAVAVVFALVRPGLAFATEPPPPHDAAEFRGPVTVHMDQARIVRLPERTATLVVGNPLIADAVVQPGGIVVITAKSYGRTNLVALDRAGAVLMEHPVEVVSPDDKTVVVYRGVDRETYSCAERCERRITVGDVPAYFTQNLGQVANVNTLAAQALAQHR